MKAKTAGSAVTVSIVTYLSCCSDETPEEKQLKGRKVCLDSQFKTYNPIWWRRLSYGATLIGVGTGAVYRGQEAICTNPCRGRECQCSRGLLTFHCLSSGCDSSMRHGTIHTQGDSSLLLSAVSRNALF